MDLWDLIKTLGEGLVSILKPCVENITTTFTEFFAPAVANVVALLMDLIGAVLGVGKKLWDFLYPIIRLVADAITVVFVVAVDSLVWILTKTVDLVAVVITWLGNLWTNIKNNCSLVTGLSEFFSLLGNAVDGVKNRLMGLVGWLGSAFDAIKRFFGVNSEAQSAYSNTVQKYTSAASRNGSMYAQSGGFGYASGGFTSNVTINVSNSGRDITATDVRKWAGIINEQLGGSF